MINNSLVKGSTKVAHTYTCLNWQFYLAKIHRHIWSRFEAILEISFESYVSSLALRRLELIKNKKLHAVVIITTCSLIV